MVTILALLLMQFASLGSGNSSCNISNSLRNEYISYARLYTPHYSAAWNRTFDLLMKAKRSKAIIVWVGFDGIKKRLVDMLERLSISVQIFDEPEWEFDAVYKPGFDVVFEMSYFSAICQYTHSSAYIKNGELDKHNRILIQSEQLNGRFGSKIMQLLAQCDQVNSCAVWDYSDFHMTEMTRVGFKSHMLFPMMYQSFDEGDVDRYGANMPIRSRPHDIGFIASLLPRRVAFDDLLGQENFTDVVYGMMSDQEKVHASYTHAKICLCLHVSEATSAGEYHRLSDVVRFGCVPIFEGFADHVGVQLIADCGGVYFVTAEELIPKSHQIINSLQADVNNTWENKTLQFREWWKRQGADLHYLLLDIFPLDAFPLIDRRL